MFFCETTDKICRIVLAFTSVFVLIVVILIVVVVVWNKLVLRIQKKKLNE